MDDHVSKLEHMGKETVKKLQDLRGAALQVGLEIAVPDNCINKGECPHLLAEVQGLCCCACQREADSESACDVSVRGAAWMLAGCLIMQACGWLCSLKGLPDDDWWPFFGRQLRLAQLAWLVPPKFAMPSSPGLRSPATACWSVHALDDMPAPCDMRPYAKSASIAVLCCSGRISEAGAPIRGGRHAPAEAAAGPQAQQGEVGRCSGPRHACCSGRLPDARLVSMLSQSAGISCTKASAATMCVCQNLPVLLC